MKEIKTISQSLDVRGRHKDEFFKASYLSLKIFEKMIYFIIVFTDERTSLSGRNVEFTKCKNCV